MPKPSKKPIEPPWHQVVAQVQPYIIKINTPQGSGTGFLIGRSPSGNICGIATAAHVIDHSHYWQQPIRIRHDESKEGGLLKEEERAIFIDPRRDAALIVCGNCPKFPTQFIELIEQGKHLKVGVEVGWLGFPAICQTDLCFFTGSVSCWDKEESSYLVDGVAINGVSGRPAFVKSGGFVRFIGVVSAYIPNRTTGIPMPGLSVIRDVSPFYEMIKQLKSLEAAKEKEEPAKPPPPQPPNEPAAIPPTPQPSPESKTWAA